MNDASVSSWMTPVDWGVIGIYVLGMLAIGFYYSRRARTRDDYLLGGRNMRPVNLGLSLFATLVSTISYLSHTGEMISYGPVMFLGIVAATPFIAWIVGWFMIPFIMKAGITSAYEILETKLGLTVRMVAASMFLALRVLWMAVIIYVTSSKVVVPLLGIDPSLTPYLCVALGAVTVVYTSLGGLRAVVFTDVVQTLILLGGALITLVIITVDLGGVGGWWPDSWPAHWPEPEWGLDINMRMPLVAMMIASITWWVCTSGSDQMAIQRFLAAGDARAARRVLIWSLATCVFVNLLLSAVGLALLGYFRANPQLLPYGKTIISEADTLFSRFIACGLPTGISGLVVAGLLAAAMSSLSSGVNSCCSVITVDFIERFRGKRPETDPVKLVRRISVLVGVGVIFLSTFVGTVEGNLLEVAFKVCNLFVAPLFGLFFMVMFVPWATAPGTLLGAVFGLLTVVTISFWEEITGTRGISFLWAMPLGLLVQIMVGMVASLVPFTHDHSRSPFS